MRSLAREEKMRRQVRAGLGIIDISLICCETPYIFVSHKALLGRPFLCWRGGELRMMAVFAGKKSGRLQEVVPKWGSSVYSS